MVHSQKRPPRPARHHAASRRRRRLARRDAGADVGALYPEMIDSVIAMAAGAAVPVQGIAWHVIGRKMIESDARFNGGDYYDHPDPLRGLQVARMVGHMTYLSAQALQTKFGRRRRGDTRQFEIDSYFEHQGKKFAAQYDANSYIRVQAAMDEMDLEEQYGSLQAASRNGAAARCWSRSTPTGSSRSAKSSASKQRWSPTGPTCSTNGSRRTNGHDTFLIDYDLITPPVRDSSPRTDSGRNRFKRREGRGDASLLREWYFDRLPCRQPDQCRTRLPRICRMQKVADTCAGLSLRASPRLKIRAGQPNCTPRIPIGLSKLHITIKTNILP